MTAPSEHHRKLSALAGTWHGVEELSPSPWEAPAGASKARVESRLDLGGAFLITDYVVDRPDGTTFRGHGIHGWDETSQRYVMYWFDALSPGIVEPAFAKWDAGTLAFEKTTAQGHVRFVYEFEGETRYRFRIENSRDGRIWNPTMEGRYVRA